ncbi:MAG: SWIM zinc finger family protein [Clostridiales bacterium]|nr:SWIM zinc finger family protein [Clostridiales bacterium]
MELTEQAILLQAPNPAAAENGRKLSKKGSFSAHRRTEDGTLYWCECAGSGKNPYRVSIDFTNADAPTCRCSCPSRQFPCKHALGLMFEILGNAPFEVAEIPQDIADKRAKQAARTAKKEAAAEEGGGPAKPKKPNTAAQKKKLAKQLEGLDMAEKMVDELLTSGLGTLAGSSAQTFDKLAKDLGSCYLTGPQTAFTRIALTVRTVQKDPAQADAAYAEALRLLVALRSTIKKGRVFLEGKLEAGDYSAEDSALFEALGGVWKLEDLKAIGSVKENVKLVQLSFDVSFDEAKKEYVERGWWLDIDSGDIWQTLNLRPVKALKYVKGDDSRFGVLEVPALYIYPGEGDRRVRWDSASTRPLTAEEQAALPALAQPDLAAATKLVKGKIKNTLAPKFLAVLVPIGQVGTVGETGIGSGSASAAYVLEDAQGGRILLRNRPEDGADHACTARLGMLPRAIPAGSALFGLMFYDGRDKTLCLHPYSVVTPDEIIRLQY